MQMPVPQVTGLSRGLAVDTLYVISVHDARLAVGLPSRCIGPLQPIGMAPGGLKLGSAPNF